MYISKKWYNRWRNLSSGGKIAPPRCRFEGAAGVVFASCVRDPGSRWRQSWSGERIGGDPCSAVTWKWRSVHGY